jgi:hypothetical protein
MHRKIISHIIDHGTSEHMHELKDVLCKTIDKLKVIDHDTYKEIEYCLYKIAYGERLSEELAKVWVASMKNKDGTHGEHWSITQTEQFNTNCDKYEWYAVLNMMYSDYYSSKFTTADYVELARNWFNDPDASEGKTLKYYMLVVR